MFTTYIIVVDDECLRTAIMNCTTPAKSSSASAPTPTRLRFAMARQARNVPVRRSLAKAEQHFHQRPVRRARPRHERIASGSKLGIDATKKLPGEGFKRPWPPLIKMDESVKAKVEKLFG